MIFEILPLSNDNPDTEIISLIEERGIELFTFYFDSIKEGNASKDDLKNIFRVFENLIK